MAIVIANAISIQESEVISALVCKHGSKEYCNQYLQQNKDHYQNVMKQSSENETDQKKKLFRSLHDMFETLWGVERRDWKKRLPYRSSGGSQTSDSSTSLSSASSSLRMDSPSNHKLPSSSDVSFAEKILGHGKHKSEIYMLFKELDPKICALNVKRVDGSQRRISKPNIMGGIRRPSLVSDPASYSSVTKCKPKTRSKFSSKEEEDIYRYMLRCACNPKLASPVRVPSPTPIPGVMNGHIMDFANDDDDDDGDSLDAGPNDPLMLVEKMIKVFYINHYLHNRTLKASNILCDPHNATVLLAADLVDLRRRINSNNLKGSTKKENICKPVYREDCFQSKEAFRRWKENQLRKVNNRIKEWCPEYANRETKRPHSFDIINGYRILIKKFFTYDWKEKKEMISKTQGSIRCSVLFCDSERLLKEFALRYGVPESFQRICLLECLTDNFLFSEWYLGCFDQNLLEMDLFLRGEYELLVDDEKDIIEKTLNHLLTKIKYCMEKSFSINDRDCKSEFNSVILILEKAVELLNRFRVSPNAINIEDLLIEYCKETGLGHYKQQKDLMNLSFADDDNDDNENDGGSDIMTPIKFRWLLQTLKINLRVFQDLCRQCPTLQRRCHTMVGAIANTLYENLMKDFAELCCDATSDINHVDSILIGLCYRLNSLDDDWKEYLKTKKKNWRKNFVITLANINFALTNTLRTDLLRFVLDDVQENIEFNPNQVINKSKLLQTEPRDCSRQDKRLGDESPHSITPSTSSAFINMRRSSSTEHRIISNLRRGSNFKIEGRISSTPSSPRSTVTREDDETLHETISGILNGIVTQVERKLSATEVVVIDNSEASDEEDDEVAAVLSASITLSASPSDIPKRPFGRPFAPPSREPAFSGDIPKVHADSYPQTTSSPGSNSDSSNTNKDTDITKCVMVTSSVIDLLFVCFRLINLKQDIFDYVLPLTHDSECENITCPHSDHKKLRGYNCFKVYHSISMLFIRYARLLLYLDLCGVELFVDEQFLNKEKTKKLIEQCKNETSGQQIGCRHALNYPAKPNLHCIFLDILLTKSGDNWELITQEMCYRINNIWNLMELLPLLEAKAMQCFQLNKTDMLFQDQDNSPKKKVLSIEFEECHDHLQETLDLQREILISKAIHIYTALFAFLVRMNCSEEMDPCVSYLKAQLKIFKYNLADECFVAVAIELWKRICQLYYQQLNTIQDTKVNPYAKVSKMEKTLKKQLKNLEEALIVNDGDLEKETNERKVEMFTRNKKIWKKLDEHSMAIFFRLQVFTKRNSSLDYLYTQCMDLRQKSFTGQFDDHVLKGEECYYLIKRQMRNQMRIPTFLGYEFLEFLSPGWRKRNTNYNPPPETGNEAASIIKDLKMIEKQSIGQCILRSYAERMDSFMTEEMRNQGADNQAVSVLAYLYRENWIAVTMQRSSSQFVMNRRPIDEERSNQQNVMSSNDVPIEQDDDTETWLPKQRFRFMDTMISPQHNTPLPGIELVGKMYNILRKTSMFSLPNDVVNDVIFKWKYMVRTKETDPRDENDEFNVKETLVDLGFPVRACSCPILRL